MAAVEVAVAILVGETTAAVSVEAVEAGIIMLDPTEAAVVKALAADKPLMTDQLVIQ